MVSWCDGNYMTYAILLSHRTDLIRLLALFCKAVSSKHLLDWRHWAAVGADGNCLLFNSISIFNLFSFDSVSSFRLSRSVSDATGACFWRMILIQELLSSIEFAKCKSKSAQVQSRERIKIEEPGELVDDSCVSGMIGLLCSISGICWCSD